MDDGPLPEGATVLPLSPDGAPIKPGDPLWAVGHPGGVRETYMSPGTYIGQGTNAEHDGKEFDSKNPDKACVAKAAAEYNPNTFDSENHSRYLAANQYQAKMHLEQGNSGGPVLDRAGDVRALCVYDN